jgi:hypothetical protein
MDFVFDPSLVLYLPLWKLDGASFVSKDACGHSCTVTGALWRPNGYYLDGDDYITLPLVVTSAMWQQTADFTIAFVAKTTAFTTTKQVVVSLGQNVEDWSYAHIGFRAVSYSALQKFRLTITVRDSDNKADDRWMTDNDTNLVNNTFYHCAVTCSGGTLAFYINGSSVGIVNDVVGDITGTLDNTKTLIGARSSGSPEGWDSHLTGFTKEVWIYSRALTPLEIQHNYLSTKWRYR